MEQQAKASKFFDTIDNIDRYFYGRKMKNFILGSICVLVLAPLLDELLEVPYDRLTYLSTLLFFFYTLILFLAWISAWRDDSGIWSWKRASSRLKTYYSTFLDTAKETKTNSRDENLYRFATFLFWGGICWKAVQNLSVFIRKPIENLTGTRRIRLRHFEQITNHWYWVAILLGIGTMYYLYRSNPQILQRIKKDIKQLLGIKGGNHTYDNSMLKVNADSFVVTSQWENPDTKRSNGFNDFASALKSWKPLNCYSEYEFQDNLYIHLKKHLPDSQIALEYPIGSAQLKNKGRADIVIDETILILSLIHI